MTGLCESISVKTGQAFRWVFNNKLNSPFEFIRDDAVTGSRGLRRESAVSYLRVRIPQRARLSHECCGLQGTGLRSARGVLSSVVCVSVISKSHQGGGVGPLELSSHKKCVMHF